MQLPVFENAYFLQSIGWAITNSFWQAGTLWLLYQLITTLDKNLSPLVKHHLSVALMGTAFTWFLFTIAENFRYLTYSTDYPGMVITDKGILKFQYINTTLPYLSFVYFVLLGLYSMQFLKDLSVNRTLQKKGLTKAPVDFRLFATNTAIHLGIKKKVQVWISSCVDVPSVTGFFKPVILLPTALINHLSVRQVEAILLHELAHIKRNDYIINLVQSFIELVLFFNPFVFLLSRIAKRERENCCDNWVMNFRYNQYDYAQALLFLEEQRQLKPVFPLPATNDKKNLLNRIKRLFHAPPQTSFSIGQQRKLAGLCCFLLIAIFGGLPYMVNTPPTLTNIQNQIKIPETVYNENSVYKEKPAKKIVNKSIVLPNKKIKDKNSAIKKHYKKEAEDHYINALINAELLTDNAALEAKLVSENDTKEVKYFVKVEEQQSGKKQTNIYFFELKNEGNKPSIRPLIIVNKLKVPAKTIPIKIVTDSIVKAAKKRVTS